MSRNSPDGACAYSPADGGAVPTSSAGRCDAAAADSAPVHARGHPARLRGRIPASGAPAPRSGAPCSHPQRGPCSGAHTAASAQTSPPPNIACRRLRVLAPGRRSSACQLCWEMRPSIRRQCAGPCPRAPRAPPRSHPRKRGLCSALRRALLASPEGPLLGGSYAHLDLMRGHPLLGLAHRVLAVVKDTRRQDSICMAAEHTFD